MSECPVFLKPHVTDDAHEGSLSPGTYTQAANAGPVSGPWSEAPKADMALTGSRPFLCDHPLGKQRYAGVSLTQDKWHRASRPMFKKAEEELYKKRKHN